LSSLPTGDGTRLSLMARNVKHCVSGVGAHLRRSA
jgi:hypothetical protein